MTAAAKPKPSQPPSRRIAGVLVPLFSIRTERSWGIGEIPDLVDFARWMAEANHKLVQLLPVGDLPGDETSPYSAATSFAIDPTYIAIDAVEDVRASDRIALLGPDGEGALASIRASSSVDYPTVRRLKHRVLRAAFERFFVAEHEKRTPRGQAFDRFCREQRAWLDDYALFRACKQRFGDSWWRAWPDGVRDRAPETLATHRAELSRVVMHYQYLQWIAHEQWQRARTEINAMGVELMGDLPFMVGVDSADVWSRTKDFYVDATIGVPPDAFSAEGQDWGLPAYDWDAMDRNDLEWVRARSAAMGRLFDCFRVDHLVGYFREWVRPKGEAPRFIPGDEPEQIARGEKVLTAIVEAAASVGARIVAEDLGVIPPFVHASLIKLRIPGYKVMMWEKNDAIFKDPVTYPTISLATSGTHDTMTLATWWESMPFDERRHALAELPALRAVARERDVDKCTPAVHAALLDALYSAGSELVLVPIQDLFATHDRVNRPATTGTSNWSYRLPKTIDELRADPAIATKLAVARDLARKHGR